MDLNSALDIIIKDLREAREIISDLRNYKGVPAFQVELAKAKCKSAEDIITLLKTIYPLKGEELAEEYSVGGSPENKQVSESVAEKPVAAEPVNVIADAPAVKAEPERVIAATPEVKAEPERVIAATPEVKEEPAKATSEAPAAKDKPEIEMGKVTPVVDAPVAGLKDVQPASDKGARPSGKRPAAGKGEAGNAILADRFGEVENRVNEKMHGRRSDDDISSRIKHSPINNLADAIGINDKFYFTREIFGGNNDAYRDAISRLNMASGIREAEGIITDCGGNEGNQEAVRELLALVKRKTGSDE